MMIFEPTSSFLPAMIVVLSTFRAEVAPVERRSVSLKTASKSGHFSSR